MAIDAKTATATTADPKRSAVGVKETPGVAIKAFNTDTTMANATPHFLSIHSPALATRPATPSATCKQPVNADTSSEAPKISGLTRFRALNTSSKMAAMVTFSGRCVFIFCQALACPHHGELLIKPEDPGIRTGGIGEPALRRRVPGAGTRPPHRRSHSYPVP